MEFTDQELAREIRSGSGVAFERLMSRYERLVYRIAYGFTGDHAAAMDVAQETFLKVYAGIDRWRGRGELKNWVARVAANEAMNWRRHATRHPTSAIDGDGFLADEPDPSDRFIGHETRQSLHRSLEILAPRQRLAVVLRYFEGMSGREISSALDCSEGTTRNLLFRSLKKLRSVLSESEEVLP